MTQDLPLQRQLLLRWLWQGEHLHLSIDQSQQQAEPPLHLVLWADQAIDLATRLLTSLPNQKLQQPTFNSDQQMTLNLPSCQRYFPKSHPAIKRLFSILFQPWHRTFVVFSFLLLQSWHLEVLFLRVHHFLHLSFFQAFWSHWSHFLLQLF